MPRLVKSLVVLQIFMGVAVAQPRGEEYLPPAFPKVKVFRVFQPDRGEVLKGIEVDGKLFEPTQTGEASQAALAASGWQAANSKGREKLALAWCSQVMLGGRPLITKAPADFPAGKQKFHPPVATTEADGLVHVRIWILPEGGNVVRKVNLYSRLHWAFTKQGRLSE